MSEGAASSVLHSALASLRSLTPTILPLTERMVRINSHTPHVAGVDAVGAVLETYLADLPLERERRSGGRYGAHLCFRTRAARSEKSVLLLGHHDTVFPPGTFESYEVEGDIARGPGVLDMKGGLALVSVALRALHEAGVLERLPLAFVSVSDEEVGSPSSRPFLEELAARARCGLVFEAGRAGDAIVTSRRGSGNALITAHGRAAHAGNALADGRNAIWALARFVDRAQALTDAERGVSVNVGLVRGGTARNTVPALAECEADLRFVDAQSEAGLIDALRAAAHDAERSIPDTRVEVQVDITRKPWSRSEATAALCARYAACQREAGLSAAEAPRAGGGSDANTVGAVGLPVIDGLGPRGAGFHTTREHIEISSLGMKAEALVRFLVGELSATAE